MPAARRVTVLAALTVLVSTLLPGAARAASVTVTSPTEGSTVSGTIRLTADAAGAARVDFYVNGVRVASDNSQPFSERWDTRRALDGDYEVMARADGQLSEPVEFTIDNEGEPAPGYTSPPPNEAPPNIPPAAATSLPECDPAAASNVVRPTGPAQYRPGSSVFGARTVMDARGATWTRETAGNYPVIFKDRAYPPGGTVCWLGGQITSSAPESTTWDVWHGTYAFYTDHPNTTIVGLRADNQGDCIGIKDPGDASLTRIHGVMLTNCHDDVIENDLMKNVETVDSVLEGYVLFGFRGGSAGAEDGRNNTWRIDDVIGWLKPQQAVYKGSAPGTGPLFKRPNQDSEEGWEPRFTITDSIFRVDQRPNHGDLSIPPGPHSGNVIVWTGSGPYPGEVPSGFRVTTDLSVWSNARAAWVAAH